MGQDVELVTADCAEQAQFLALQRDFELLLLGPHLQGKALTEIIQGLRRIFRYEKTPLLIACDEYTPTVIAGIEAGADDYLDMSMHPQLLNARFQSLLSRERRIEQIKEQQTMLGRYVSTRTADMAAHFAETGELPEPVERSVTIMFADVRGFTEMSQQFEPKVLFGILSQHLAMQVEMVYRHNGYVDKFGGDGVMAVFDRKDSAVDACQCALDIVGATIRGRGNGGPPRLPLGVGINHGPVFLGNIGFQQHLDFSAIGETVNLAARLCGMASAMSVVVSQAAKDACQDEKLFAFDEGSLVDVRGLQGKTKVYQITRRSGLHARPDAIGVSSYQYDRRVV